MSASTPTSQLLDAPRPAPRGKTERHQPLRTIHSFDGLRGWAALGIVVYHCRPTGHASPLLEHLSVGVDLFFVLSGFVMALTYRGLFAARLSVAAVRLFLTRRLARIYPLYGLVTLAIAVLVATGHSARAPRDGLPVLAAANLLMVQSWFGLSSLDFAAWSISTEWAAYLAFPLLALLLLRPGAGRWRLPCAAVAVAVVVGVYLTPALSPVTVGRGGNASLGAGFGALAQCAGDFTLGMLALLVAEHRFGRAIARQPVAGLAIAATVAALALGPMHPLPLAALVLLFPPLLVACSGDRGPVARAFAGPVGRILGAWSYAVYLIHPGLLGLDRRLVSLLTRHDLPAPAALATAVTIAVVLVLAASVHRWLELPMRRLIRSRTEATPTGAPGAARV